MSVYEVVVRETVYTTYQVRADSLEEAEEVFWNGVWEVLDEEVSDAGIESIYEVTD